MKNIYWKKSVDGYQWKEQGSTKCLRRGIASKRDARIGALSAAQKRKSKLIEQNVSGQFTANIIDCSKSDEADNFIHEMSTLKDFQEKTKLYKRTIKKELSFEGENLLRDRHKIHPYPAMLHPLLVDYLIEQYAKSGCVVFDPFCGSGVVPLQANINGYHSIGFDINPLALLIAKTKTQKYIVKELSDEFSSFKNAVLKSRGHDTPKIKNIDYWYTKDVIDDLSKIRYVLKHNDYKYKDLFAIIFAFVCRNQSLTRNSEFKRYRIEEEKIKNIKSNVLDKMFTHCEKTIEIITNSTKPTKSSSIMLANSEKSISSDLTYDLVITSPPYGDSRTTVAYGEYSSFGSEWIDDINSYGGQEYKVDKESVGKRGILNKDLKKHTILSETIDSIAAKDQKRAKDVLYFFNGYYNVIRNVIANLKVGGKACFVVGNRTVKDHQIPMDQITSSFLESMGMQFENIFVREICNKVMPSKNSPTNVVGAKTQTMTKEYVVIFRKP